MMEKHGALKNGNTPGLKSENTQLSTGTLLGVLIPQWQQVIQSDHLQAV